MSVLKTSIIICAVTISAFFGSCRHKGAEAIGSGDTLTSQASLLTIIDKGDYTVADIRNPWASNSGTLLERYLLVPHDYSGDLPEGTVVRVPLKSSIVYSGVYAGAIDELGAADAITGVADGQYFGTRSVIEGLRSGRITDVGNSMSPSVERIVDLEPGAIILSPYQDMEMGAVEKLGIPVIKFVDYMESTPLGRAEWIRLLGLLYGNHVASDSIYSQVSKEYISLCQETDNTVVRPIVITEQPMPGGSWDVPAGGSYMAKMLADAGADYPWAETAGGGSLKLDAPAVLDRAADADYWLIRSYGPLSLKSLGSGNPLSTHFKAFKNGTVYICDTSVVPLFDEFPFHPERLLREYITIFHPEISAADLHYYHRAE